jgi:hypothetical protein
MKPLSVAHHDTCVRLKIGHNEVWRYSSRHCAFEKLVVMNRLFRRDSSRAKFCCDMVMSQNLSRIYHTTHYSGHETGVERQLLYRRNWTIELMNFWYF